MLPIKNKHYNPLTYQFEDEIEGFNFYPTRYTPLVSETNQCDVEIVGIKSDLARYILNKQSDKEIRLAKLNHRYDLEISEGHNEVEIVKALCQVHIAQNNKRTTKKNRNRGLFSFFFQEKDDIIIESEKW